ncbi:MAG: 50S ribosomal protein L15 [Spirochaetia bacterium]|nr:50S ribosomal protein L15 [Spirochaetia bacterium]
MGQINAPIGAHTRKTIVGRGSSSKGRTCGRGNNGQNARSGGGVRPGFEGGQMPLFRRVARRGFSNYPFKDEYEIISLDKISLNYEDKEVVNVESLKEKNLVKGHNVKVKVLANGELTKKVVFEGLKISASAVEIIKTAGGEIK